MIPIPKSVLARQVAGNILQDLQTVTAQTNALLFYGRPADAHLQLPEITAEDLQEALGDAAPRLNQLLEDLNQ